MHFEPLDAHRCGLGESPLWHEGGLWCVDILGRQVIRWRGGERTHWDVAAQPGCLAPRQGGGLLVARRDGVWTLPERGAAVQVAVPAHDPTHCRLNDGKADAHGRLWVGGMSDRGQPECAWHVFEPGRTRRVLAGTTVANGLAWSPDGRWMYRADSPRRRVWRHRFDVDVGAVDAGEVWLELASGEGYPDGAAVDADGCYWLALWEGAGLLQVAPDGRRLQHIELPVRRPTMPCFGGADFRTLYVTSAAKGQPAGWDGAVLVARAPVAGLPSHLAAL